LGPKVVEFERKCVEIEIIGFLNEKNQPQTHTQRIFKFKKNSKLGLEISKK
jgi:hypothetical protein